MPCKCQGEQDGMEEPDVNQALAEKSQHGISAVPSSQTCAYCKVSG